MNESRPALAGTARLAERFFLLFLLAAGAPAAVLPDPGVRASQPPLGAFALFGDRARVPPAVLLLAALPRRSACGGTGEVEAEEPGGWNAGRRSSTPASAGRSAWWSSSPASSSSPSSSGG